MIRLRAGAYSAPGGGEARVHEARRATLQSDAPRRAEVYSAPGPEAAARRGSTIRAGDSAGDRRVAPWSVK
jgi:hypothetical protein